MRKAYAAIALMGIASALHLEDNSVLDALLLKAATEFNSDGTDSLESSPVSIQNLSDD